MSNDTADSQPNPSLMYDVMTSFMFADAAGYGFCESGGQKYSAGQFITSSAGKAKNLDGVIGQAGMMGAGFGLGSILGTKRVCTMIVLNQTHSALKLNGNTFNDGTHHGVQTLHPAKAKTDTHGNISYSDPNIIPGPIMAPNREFWKDLVGVGVYRFEKDLSVMGLGVYGVSGALSFHSESDHLPDDIAVAFNVGQGSANTVAITCAPSSNGGIEGMKTYIDSLDGPVLKANDRDLRNGANVMVAASLYPWDANKSTDSDARHNSVLMVKIAHAS